MNTVQFAELTNVVLDSCCLAEPDTDYCFYDIYPPVLSGPDPPTGVSVDVTGSDTAVVSWTPSMSRMCDVVIGNYNVRYQMSNSNGAYTTVNTSSTSVALRDLVPNAEYTLEVAGINSNGQMSPFSALLQFTVTPAAAPSKIPFPATLSVHRPFNSILLATTIKWSVVNM